MPTSNYIIKFHVIGVSFSLTCILIKWNPTISATASSTSSHNGSGTGLEDPALAGPIFS